MGIPTDTNEHQLKILSVISKLTGDLEWYKQFIFDFNVPENTGAFTSRNVDLLRDIDNLSIAIERFKTCYESDNYSYSPEEYRIKMLQAQVLMRHIFT
jgi:hypothetical protein